MAQFMTKAEVSGMLRVGIRTIDRLRRSGELKAVVVRGRVRFDPRDVRAFIDARREGEGQP
jgi:excisionase family DNA binding protein